MLSRYTFVGRRCTVGRRAGDPASLYVDRLGSGLAAILLAIFTFHCLDAVFTLSHLSHGGQELNPFMALLLAVGPGTFVSTKLAIAGVGLCFLGIHKNFPMVRTGILLLFVLYAGVIGYHIFLLCQS